MYRADNLFARFPLHAGVIFGILPLPLHLFLTLEQSHILAALSLVLIAGIYMGFAFKDGRPSVLVIELLGAGLFLWAAFLGLTGMPLAIIAALVLHGVWDMAHHGLINTDIPHWYVRFCMVIDWLMAAGLWIIWTILA